MRNHTQKTFNHVWSRKDGAASRAKREASSAPILAELWVYEKFLKRAIANRKTPKVIVLGATPELRDLCLKHNCRVLAVDISLEITTAMDGAMEHHTPDRDLFMRCDWLEMDKYLKNNNFDIILADGSLNNIAPEDHSKLLEILKKLLKPGGSFISRNTVFLPEREVRDIAEIVKEYKKGKNNWLGLLLELGYYSPLAKKVYNPSSKKFSFSKLFRLIETHLQQRTFSLAKVDREKLDNLQKHGGKITHITFPKKEFDSLLKKYFRIISVGTCKKYAFCRYAPIYFLKAKK